MRRVGNKYGAVKTAVDGIIFASKKEAKRYAELKLMERAKEIAELKLQPKFPIVVEGQLICVYVADFHYRYRTLNGWVIEDCKGMKTPVYRIKKKLMKALYGIEILET